MGKLGLIHQGREDLGQDPAVPDNPVADCIESGSSFYSWAQVSTCQLRWNQKKHTPADCGLKPAPSGSKAGESTN